jgi:hypothetical protein
MGINLCLIKRQIQAILIINIYWLCW